MRALNGPLQTLRRTVTRRPLLADLATSTRGDGGAHPDRDRRRRSCLHRHQPLAEEAAAGRRPVPLSQDRPRRQSGGAGALQLDPRCILQTLSRRAAGRRRPMRHAHRTDAEFHLRTDVGMSRNASCPWSSLFLVSAPPRPPDRKRLSPCRHARSGPACRRFEESAIPERYNTRAKRLDTSCFGVDRHRTMNARREHRTSVRREH